MRALIIITILVLNLFTLTAQNTKTNSLTINFEITKFDEGQILFALYNTEENHMDNTFKTAEVRVENGKAKVVVNNLKSGYYSFSYFHDVDSNGELDTNLMGIPKEPYGFSNGEKGRLGPPSFDECKIKIEKDLNINISVK